MYKILYVLVLLLNELHNLYKFSYEYFCHFSLWHFAFEKVHFKRCLHYYRGADKSLTRQGRKQAQKHVRDARDFNNIETRAVIKFSFFLQGKAPKEIHAILTETLACFLPGRAKDLSAPLYI